MSTEPGDASQLAKAKKKPIRSRKDKTAEPGKLSEKMAALKADSTRHSRIESMSSSLVEVSACEKNLCADRAELS
jgi:hypothetical protein